MVEITDLREVSVKDLRSFIAERGFSYAGLLERHELEARAEEAAAATQCRGCRGHCPGLEP